MSIRDKINKSIEYRVQVDSSCKWCNHFANDQEESHCYALEFDEGVVLNVEEDHICKMFEVKQ